MTRTEYFEKANKDVKLECLKSSREEINEYLENCVKLGWIKIDGENIIPIPQTIKFRKYNNIDDLMNLLNEWD